MPHIKEMWFAYIHQGPHITSLQNFMPTILTSPILLGMSPSLGEKLPLVAGIAQLAISTP